MPADVEANTVPPIWVRFGLVVAPTVTVEQPSLPTAVKLDTVCQACAAGFHHETPCPVLRPHTLKLTAVKVDPAEMATSK